MKFVLLSLITNDTRRWMIQQKWSMALKSIYEIDIVVSAFDFRQDPTDRYISIEQIGIWFYRVVPRLFTMSLLLMDDFRFEN